MTRRNTHMTHLDESHFIDGQHGAELSMELLQSLINEDTASFVTQKWDGAPAVFAGTDPADGKFFVATKSVFNKTPKLYKNVNEILENEPEGKAVKLVEALRQLAKLDIPKDTVLQGDILWSNLGEQTYRTYAGKRYLTVHPNTLIYGWVSESTEAKQVRNSNFGIVFHTSYTGKGSLSEYSATFGYDARNLKEVKGVWVRDAVYKRPDLSEAVKQYNNEILDEAEAVSCDFDGIAKIMSLIPEAFSGARIQAFYNSQIRQGLYPYDANAYFKHVQDYYAKQMDKVKTDAAKAKRETQVKQLLDMMKKKEQQFHNAFYYTSKINEAKLGIIDGLNNGNEQVCFIEEGGTLKRTYPEGYVAVDVITGNGLKLIDRQEFSHFNFNESVKKGWEK